MKIFDDGNYLISQLKHFLCLVLQAKLIQINLSLLFTQPYISFFLSLKLFTVFNQLFTIFLELLNSNTKFSSFFQ